MEQNINPKYEALIYKTLSAIHTTSFYFWATFGLAVITIFAGRLFTEGLGVDETLNQLFLVGMGIPVGLLWWRYVTNRRHRSELVKEFGDEAQKEKETITALTKGYSKKGISFLMRIRSFFTLIGIFEGLLFIFSAEDLVTNSESKLGAMTGFYAVVAVIAVVTAIVLTFVINYKYKQDVDKFSPEIPTE